jgi:protein-L-isoaspartate(D-aspartate) O-methyltransferase
MLDFAQARRMMVDCQLRTFDVNDLAVLSAMDDVPRECFVPEGREALAYMDKEIPVSDGLDVAERRVMLAPMVLARLIQALQLRRGKTVLDVACGLGYSSAVMARLGAVVTGREESEALAAAARARLGLCGYGSIAVTAGPLDRGCAEGAPYDAILVNGAVEREPKALVEQLAAAGRLACLEGSGGTAKGMLYVRSGDAVGGRPLFDAAAAPLMAFRSLPGFVF